MNLLEINDDNIHPRVGSSMNIDHVGTKDLVRNTTSDRILSTPVIYTTALFIGQRFPIHHQIRCTATSESFTTIHAVSSPQ